MNEPTLQQLKNRIEQLETAIQIAIACGKPVMTSLYDEEGVDGWRWQHPDGRVWEEIGDHCSPPLLHPILIETLQDKSYLI